MSTAALSKRELEVLRLMAKGNNNKQISADLQIAESTVRFHISHILTKLQAGDRTQAVVLAVKQGLVSL